MKTETLISQLAPTQKKGPSSNESLLDNVGARLPSNDGPSFASFLQTEKRAVQRPAPQPAKRAAPQPRNDKAAAPQKSPSQPVERSETKTSQSDRPETSRVREEHSSSEQAEKLRRYQEKKKAREAAREAEANDGQTQVVDGADTQTAQTSSVLDNKKADAKPSQGREVLDGKTTQKLGQSLGSSESLTKEVPALAIVTGHLENVEPTAIPKIVSTNEFMKGAFATSDIKGFLNQPQTIAGILNQLGLPEAEIDKLASHGINIATLVTPKELLGKLGFDVQRIGSELEILKDNISLPSGLASYIERAQKLQGNNGKSTEIAEDLKGQKWQANREDNKIDAVSNQRTFGQAAPTTQIADSGFQIPSQNMPQARATGDQATLAQAIANVEKPAESAPIEGQIKNIDAAAQTQNQQAQPVSQNVMMGMTANPLNQPVVPQGQIAQVIPGSNELNPTQAIENPELAVENIESAEEMVSLKSSGIEISKPKGNTILGEFNSKISSLDSETIKLDQQVTATQTTPEQNVEEMMSDWQPSKATQMASDKSTGLINKQDVQVDSAETPENKFDMRFSEFDYGNATSSKLKSTSSSQPSTIANALNPLAAQGLTAKAENVQQNHIERMAATATGVRFNPEAGQSQGGNTRGDSSSQQNHSQNRGQVDFMNAAGITKVSNTKAAEAEFAKHMKLDNHNAVTNQVIDRARMMVKEGGGEVLLDLGNEKLGKVELAMNVRHDRVDLKIIAANDQVREILSQDLGSLREALAIQDLNLSEVEVAVSGESTSFQFNEFAEKGQGETGDPESKGNEMTFTSKSSTSKTITRPTRIPQHQGSIQVRA